MAKGVLNDADILSVTAEHPTMGRLRYERTYQYQWRKVYYRLLYGEKGTGSLTDEKHARATVQYWREKGWIVP